MAFRSAAKAADLINFHYPWPFGDVLALLGNPGKPYVVTYHSDIVRQRFAEVLYAPLRAKFMEEANAVVATSPAYARTSEYLSRSGRSVDVIPLSIDSSRIPETPEVVATQWELRFPKPFFFFVGVLRYYKGLEFLVEAARLTGFDVVIAGDGPERERLRYLSSGLKNIYFLGSISDQDKFALMRLCRAVVFPSHLRAEAFGVSLLEGAALGKALISTEIGTGTSYVNAHEETGIVVPAANAEAFAKAMRILVENPEYAARLGVNAKDRCVRLFDTSRIGQKYLDLYNRVLSFNG